MELTVTHLRTLLLLSALWLFTTAAPALAQAASYSIATFDERDISDGLTSACARVYIQAIPNCRAADFAGINACSSACQSSLQTVQQEAITSCLATSNNLPSTSMLTYFAEGKGVEEICTLEKAPGALGASTGAPAVPELTSSPPPSESSESTLAESAEIYGADISMALPNGAIIAIVVVVIVAFLIFGMFAIHVFRKFYRK